MRTALTACLALLPVTALAHTGHIAPENGHDHWVIGTAFAAAAAFSIFGALRARRSQ